MLGHTKKPFRQNSRATIFSIAILTGNFMQQTSICGGGSIWQPKI